MDWHPALHALRERPFVIDESNIHLECRPGAGDHSRKESNRCESE